jgi:hypothetical protein
VYVAESIFSLSISADMTYTIHIQYSETSAAGGFLQKIPKNDINNKKSAL